MMDEMEGNEGTLKLSSILAPWMNVDIRGPEASREADCELSLI
jgi:hypothetical protein